MRPSENLGQVLFGERIESSPYKVSDYLKSTYFSNLVEFSKPKLSNVFLVHL